MKRTKTPGRQIARTAKEKCLNTLVRGAGNANGNRNPCPHAQSVTSISAGIVFRKPWKSEITEHITRTQSNVGLRCCCICSGVLTKSRGPNARLPHSFLPPIQRKLQDTSKTKQIPLLRMCCCFYVMDRVLETKGWVFLRFRDIGVQSLISNLFLVFVCLRLG